MNAKDVFYLLSVAFQVGIIALLLLRSNRKPLHLGLAGILLLNAIEALNAGTNGWMDTHFILWIDIIIVFLIGYVFSQLPKPLASHWWFLGLILAWTAAFWGMVLDGWLHGGYAYIYFQNIAFAVAGSMFVLHTMRLIVRMPRGPFRSFVLLLSGGLLAPLFSTQAMEIAAFARAYTPGALSGLMAAEGTYRGAVDLIVDKGLTIALLWIIALSAVQVARVSIRRRIDFGIPGPFLLAIGTFVFVYVQEFLIAVPQDFFAPARELPSQFLRPIMILLAIARYDRVHIFSGQFRPIFATTSLVGGAIGFGTLMIVPFWSNPQFRTEGFLFAVVAGMSIVAAWFAVLFGRGELQRRQEHVEFQRAYAQNPDAFDEIRRRFHITKGEGEQLVQALQNFDD